MLFSVFECFVTELNQCKVPRGHRSTDLIPNFPILAHLKLTQTFAKKKETAEFQFNHAVTLLS